MKKQIFAMSMAIFAAIGLSSCGQNAKTQDPVLQFVPKDALEKKHKQRITENETPYTLCYENQDGTKSLYIFQSPIAFQSKDGQFKLYDNALVDVTDKELRKQRYAFENKASDIKVYFPEQIQKNPFVIRHQAMEYQVSPAFPEQISAPKLTKGTDLLGREYDKAVYTGKGQSCAFFTTSGGLYSEAVLDQKPANGQFAYRLKFSRNIILENSYDRYVVFKDADTLEPCFVVYPSYLTDINGKAYLQNKLEVTRDGDAFRVTITLDPAAADAQELYPLTMTPSFEVYRPKMPDSSVYNSASFQNCYLNNYAVLGNSSLGQGVNYLRMRVNYVLGSYEQNVKSAGFYTTVLSGGGQEDSIRLERLGDIWDSTRLFWENRPAPKKLESENKVTAAGLCRLDITKFIKSALNDDTHNTEVYGLLASLQNTDSCKIVSSSDNTRYPPYIQIDFYDLPWSFEKFDSINPGQE